MPEESEEKKPWEKKKRKGPRLVEAKEGQEFERKDFEELLTHAKNSGVWYTTNASKSSKQIREKLYEKGYPEGDVFVEIEGVRTARNFVEETVAYLEDILLLDDRFFGERLAARCLRLNQGRNKAKFMLTSKGVPEDLTEDILDEIYAESADELLEFVTKLWEQEAKRHADQPYKIKQKVFQKTMSRGWDFGSVSEAIEAYLEGLEED